MTKGGAVYLNEKAKEKTGTDPVSKLPESVQKSINEQNAAASSGAAGTTTAATSSAATGSAAAATSSAGHDAARQTTTSVPSEVTSSQKEAHADPEAAGSPEAVKVRKTPAILQLRLAPRVLTFK